MSQSFELEREYGPLRLVRETGRFRAYEGRDGGSRVFIKQAIDPRLRERLVVEATGLMSLYELDPEAKLYQVPRMLALTSEYIVTQWVDGDIMEGDFQRAAPEVVDTHLPYLATLYGFFDNSSHGPTGLTRFNRPGKERQVEDTITSLQERHVERVIDLDLIRKIGGYIASVIPSTETRYTHGDLQPGNIFIHTGQPATLVDCETCSWLWPRHYNIVNFLVNYRLRYPTLDSAFHHMFESYLREVKLRPEDHIDAFNVSAGMRGLQILIEQGTEQGSEQDAHRYAYIEGLFQRITTGMLFMEV